MACVPGVAGRLEVEEEGDNSEETIPDTEEAVGRTCIGGDWNQRMGSVPTGTVKAVVRSSSSASSSATSCSGGGGLETNHCGTVGSATEELTGLDSVSLQLNHLHHETNIDSSWSPIIHELVVAIGKEMTPSNSSIKDSEANATLRSARFTRRWQRNHGFRHRSTQAFWLGVQMAILGETKTIEHQKGANLSPDCSQPFSDVSLTRLPHGACVRFSFRSLLLSTHSLLSPPLLPIHLPMGCSNRFREPPECETWASVLGPRYPALQATYALVSFCLLLFTLQRIRHKWKTSTHLWRVIHACSVFTAVSAGLRSIDPHGFGLVLPYLFYSILMELSSACLLIQVLIFAEAICDPLLLLHATMSTQKRVKKAVDMFCIYTLVSYLVLAILYVEVDPDFWIVVHVNALFISLTAASTMLFGLVRVLFISCFLIHPVLHPETNRRM